MRAKLTLGKNLNVGSIKRALYKEKILHILNKILAKFHIKNEVLKTRFDKRKIVYLAEVIKIKVLKQCCLQS
jgi:hypothetical protein